ncbi:LVIVD repeat-containing protein [Natrialbaceae archaeon A-CW3]
MERRALLRSLGVATAGTALGLSASSAQATRTTAQESYEPLGVVDVDGACEAVVGDDGETAYIAAIDGFVTVDISDPADPTILADRRDLLEDDYPEFSDILDVKVSGDRLAVVGPGGVSSSLFNGFVLYDVSDPADPVQVSEPYETGYHIHNCFLEDDRLYLVANDLEENPLAIFDVSDDDPEEVGHWSLLEYEPRWAEVSPYIWYLHDVYVQSEIAYLAYWNAGTYLLDVSDPADPTYLSHVAETTIESQLEIDEGEESDYQLGLPGNDHYSAVDDTGTILAVGREAWETDAPEADGPGGIDLFDVSDPTDPVFAASIEAPDSPDATYPGGQWTTAHNFEIRDGWLYSSWYRGGVKIHDLSTLEEPEEITAWRDPTAAGFWTARVAHSGETFVASSTPLIPGAGIDGALYVFPSEPGEQADPPSFEEADDDDGGNGGDGDDTGETDEEGGGDDGTDDTDETTDTDDSSGTTPSADDTTDDPIPGFTSLAAATGIAGGAVALERRRRTRTENNENG